MKVLWIAKNKEAQGKGPHTSKEVLTDKGTCTSNWVCMYGGAVEQ
jgi:hypothetical protein